MRLCMKAELPEGISLVGKVWPYVTTKASYKGQMCHHHSKVEVCDLWARLFPPAEIPLELLPSLVLVKNEKNPNIIF